MNLQREDGVAMAEFALIIPVFILLFLGITAFGQTFYYWLNANHAANETARWAAVDHNPIAGKTLQQQVVDNIGTADVCISFEDDTPLDGNPGVATVGNFLTVRVSKALRLKIRLPMIPVLDTGITIRGTSTQRIEQLVGPPTPSGARTPGSYSTADNIGTCT
jgi:Flp pilus assembly protein TadG